MRLASRQHAFFEAFGFLRFAGLFRAEIKKITEAFEGDEI